MEKNRNIRATSLSLNPTVCNHSVSICMPSIPSFKILVSVVPEKTVTQKYLTELRTDGVTDLRKQTKSSIAPLFQSGVIINFISIKISRAVIMSTTCVQSLNTYLQNVVGEADYTNPIPQNGGWTDGRTDR